MRGGKVSGMKGKSDGMGTQKPPVPLCAPAVKMRLEHSAECDKRKIINHSSAENVQSPAEHILNRPTVRFVWTSPENYAMIGPTIPVGE